MTDCYDWVQSGPLSVVVDKALYEQEGLGCGWCRHPCHTHTFKGCSSQSGDHPMLSPGVITRGALVSALKVAENFWRGDKGWQKAGWWWGAETEGRWKAERNGSPRHCRSSQALQFPWRRPGAEHSLMPCSEGPSTVRIRAAASDRRTEGICRHAWLSLIFFKRCMHFYFLCMSVCHMYVLPVKARRGC